MKKKRTTQSAFLSLCILIGLFVFCAGVLLTVSAANPKVLTRQHTRNTDEHVHRANASRVAPGGGVYEVWVARYNGPVEGNSGAVGIGLDASGNVYVAGYSLGTSTGFDYATIRYDSAGQEQWVARYNGPFNNNDFGNAMAVDSSGNVYVTGYSATCGTSTEWATVGYDLAGQERWVSRRDRWGAVIAVDDLGNIYVSGLDTVNHLITIKYNSTGAELWVAVHDGGDPTAIAVDKSGNVYLTGRRYSYPDYDYQTIKYDSSGQEQWAAIYNGPGNNYDAANAIAVDDSGNVYVTGGSFGSTSTDYATIKYNSTGQQQWVARYDQGGYDEAHAIAIDSSGNVYVTGQIADPDSYPDYGTIKYDSAGQQQWLARYNGPPGNRTDAATAIALDASANVYVTGRSQRTTYIYSDYDYATVKYDSGGQQQWVARYDGPGDADDQAVGIALDQSGNVYVTGTSNLDFATIKYGQGPTPTPTPTATASPTPTSTATPTSTPTASPPPPASCSPTPTLTASPPSPTPPTPTATFTPTPTPTATLTPTPIATVTATATFTPSATPTPSEHPRPTPRPNPTLRARPSPPPRP